MKHKLKIRLALWCYYHGLERLAYKLYPSIGWYIIGADFSRTMNTVRSALAALGEGYSSERPDSIEGSGT